MHPPTDVCLTVDTEFSINGAFSDPYNAIPMGEPRVHCPADGRDNGLPFILETLNDTGLQATFFVETANIAYFGDAPMGRVVNTLLQSSQDVQFHLHPCWQAFSSPDWQEKVLRSTPCDQSAELPIDALSSLIRQGIDTFERWGADRPLALRTGNVSAGPNVYAAMENCDLSLASNIAMGYAPPSDPKLHLKGGLHRIGAVTEVPILSYRQLNGLRILAITSTSWPETKALLGIARRSGISPVVILTHPFEFIKSPQGIDMTNKVNQSRLQKLCSFIASNPNDFQATTFGAAGAKWQRSAPKDIPTIKAPIGASLRRMAVNVINDRVSFI